MSADTKVALLQSSAERDTVTALRAVAVVLALGFLIVVSLSIASRVWSSNIDRRYNDLMRRVHAGCSTPSCKELLYKDLDRLDHDMENPPWYVLSPK